MTKLLILVLMAAAATFGQYKVEPAGPPPTELAPPIQQALQKDGIKVVAPTGAVVCELWFRSSDYTGAKPTEENVTLPEIPQGALIGAIRFTARGSDRRGQTIKPGVYTLRYAPYPVNGDHQGVAPQRDFALAVPAADDKDLAPVSGWDPLMKLSDMASGTPHPAVFSIWKDDHPTPAPAITKQGEGDWVVHAKLGDTPLAMIVVGTFQG
jgi:hypothetical protein